METPILVLRNKSPWFYVMLFIAGVFHPIMWAVRSLDNRQEYAVWVMVILTLVLADGVVRAFHRPYLTVFASGELYYSGIYWRKRIALASIRGWFLTQQRALVYLTRDGEYNKLLIYLTEGDLGQLCEATHVSQVPDPNLK